MVGDLSEKNIFKIIWTAQQLDTGQSSCMICCWEEHEDETIIHNDNDYRTSQDKAYTNTWDEEWGLIRKMDSNFHVFGGPTSGP